MNLEAPPKIIVALDLPLTDAGKLVQKLKPAEDKIAAYKVSSLNAIESGLKATVAELRQFTQKPIIYDHQKGCTDIPEIVARQVKLAADCGVNSFIAVPLGAGPESLTAFVNACNESKILPIVLLSMTHQNAGDYLKKGTPDAVFTKTKELGVKYFVAPGNQTAKLRALRKKMDAGMFITSPGIGAQGGECRKAVKAGTDYPIIGRAIYSAEDPVKAVEEFYKQAQSGFGKRK